MWRIALSVALILAVAIWIASLYFSLPAASVAP